MGRKTTALAASFEEDPDARSDSRARDALRATDRRVMHCVQLMSTGKWERGGMAESLAAEWGVTPSTVDNVAAEAARHLRLAHAPDAFLSYVMAELHRVLEGYDDPAVKIAAAKTLIDGFRVMGAKAAGSTAERPYVATSSQQVEALVSELSAPGPELAEALERTGWRRVVETTGEDAT